MNTYLGSNHLGMELLKSDMSNGAQYCQVSKKKSKKTTTTTYSQISNTFYWTNKDWNQKVSFTPWRSGQSRCYYKSEKLVSDRLIFFQRAMRGFIILWR